MAYRLRIEFSKKEQMRYISHLDLMRLFMRAIRRGDLPIRMTQGFNPHPKISIKRAIKLGLESESEEAVFALEDFINPGEFKEKLQAQLPEGIRIKNVKRDFN